MSIDMVEVITAGPIGAPGMALPSTFDYVVEEGVIVTNDVYEEVARLTTSSRPAGTYVLHKSMLYSLNTTVRSAYLRFSLDGGATWTEVRKEPTDNTDLIPLTHPNVIVHTDGGFDIIVQSRKESAGDVLNIVQLTLTLERKI